MIKISFCFNLISKKDKWNVWIDDKTRWIAQLIVFITQSKDENRKRENSKLMLIKAVFF